MEEEEEEAWMSTPGSEPPVFEVGTREAGGAVVVELRGDIDLSSADELRRELAAAIAREPALVVADLSEVDLLDSTGLGVLISFAVDDETPCDFAVLAPGGLQVRGVLSISGVLDQMTVLDSEADIGRHLAGQAR